MSTPGTGTINFGGTHYTNEEIVHIGDNIQAHAGEGEITNPIQQTPHSIPPISSQSISIVTLS